MQVTEDRGRVEAEAADIIRATAIDLSGSIEALVDHVSQLIVDDVPDVLDGDSYRRSNRANLDLKLSVLRQGTDLVVPPAPRDAMLYARDLARRGADVSVLLRSYELGHRHFWGEWTQRFASQAADPAVLAALYDMSARFLFAYFDSVPASVTSEFRAERQRRSGTAAAQRAEAVCNVLGGLLSDVRGAERTLDYPLLDGRHVGLVFVGSGGELDARQVHAARRSVQRLGHRLGLATLVVAPETTTLWAWAEVPATMAPEEVDERLRELRGPAGLTLSVGDVGTGLDGFRETHREAEHALRHATARGCCTPAVVHYRDISALLLLSSDARRAGRFLERELRLLAAPDEATARTRSTLRVFLEENCNQARTARRLGVHYNTVTYRLRQAEALLGRPVTERRFDLEAALLLHSLAADGGAGDP